MIALPTFVGRTFGLVGATAASQGISFLGVLVNARLYSPAEFGLFALFNVVFTFATIAVTWRYELAIVTAPNASQARDATLFVGIATASSALLVSAIVWCIFVLDPNDIISSRLQRALWALPVLMSCIGLILAGNSWCTRHRAFGYVAAQKIAMAGTTLMAQAALAGSDLFGSGLVTGAILGHLAGVCIYIRPLISAFAASVQGEQIVGRLKQVAILHRGHFLHTVPYTVLSQLYYQAPVVILGAYFSSREVGLFSLANRITLTPFGLIPTAAGHVLFPELVQDRHRLSAWESRLLALLLCMGLIAAPVAAIVIAMGPDLFAWLLGEEWRAAGGMAQILILPNLLVGLCNGYDRLYFVLDRQRAALGVTGAVTAASVTLTTALSYIHAGPTLAVAGWAVCQAGFAISWAVTIYRIAGFSIGALLRQLSVVLFAIFVLSAIVYGALVVVHGWQLIVCLTAIGAMYGAVLLVAFRRVLPRVRAAF